MPSAATNLAQVSILHPDSSSESVAREAGTWPRVFTTEGVHPFDEIEWKVVDAEIRAKDKIIFQQKGVEVPAWWNEATVKIVADKYFRMINGVREYSVKQVFTRVARKLRSWGEEQDFFATEKDAEIFEHELIYALLHQFGAFNSPVWFNLGVPGRRQTASACFISSIDDTLDEIMNFQRSELNIFASGSGSGANISSLRSSYEKLSSSGSYTTGPLSWMRGQDQYAGGMKSGGGTRNAAKMIVMDMDHPDILETRDGRPGFIRSKADEEKLAHKLVDAGLSAAFEDPNGAYKRVMLQNANLSVSVPDAFMQAVLDDGAWKTKERTTGKNVHEYKARQLWREIAEAAWTCGDPGVQFTDTINRWHTTPKSGRIKASNPCSEFLHVDDTACNLAAINLMKFFDGRKLNLARLKQTTRIFTSAQMMIVDKSEYPTEKIRINSSKLRPIGMNYGNLGALLMKLGLPYDSDEGRAVAARLASLMTGLTYVNAARTAARIGAFPEFEKNRDDMLGVMHMHKDADARINERWSAKVDPLGTDVTVASAGVWDDAIRLGNLFGYNISQATVQAPLGTISYLMMMDTTGIEPAFSLVSYKTLAAGGRLTLVNNTVRDALVNLGYSTEAVDAICKYVETNGCVEGATGFNHDHLPIFDCAAPSGPSGRCLTPLAHLKMMAAIQPLITCAQSKTVNLPPTITVDDIASIYMESWRLGLKCVALYRDGCKASQPLTAKPDEQKKEAIIAPASTPILTAQPVKESVEQIAARALMTAQRRRMPDDVKSWRHKFEINGYRGYILVSEYPDGTPGEVFLKLGKPGSTISGLIDGYTQLLSIALQYGVPLPKLITSFIDTRFEPAGMTTNRQVRIAKSLYDYLFKVLDVHYYKGEHSGLAERIAAMEEADAKKEVAEGISRAIKLADADAASAMQAAPKPGIVARKSLDAPPCMKCGEVTMRKGACYYCENCHTSTGCS